MILADRVSRMNVQATGRLQRNFNGTADHVWKRVGIEHIYRRNQESAFMVWGRTGLHPRCLLRVNMHPYWFISNEPVRLFMRRSKIGTRNRFVSNQPLWALLWHLLMPGQHFSRKTLRKNLKGLVYICDHDYKRRKTKKVLLVGCTRSLRKRNEICEKGDYK